MVSLKERNLRLISVDIKNISGLTTSLKFNSNLVIIYGYNRKGKTIFINALKYAFTGFRGHKIDLSKILGTSKEGHIFLVFEYNGVLYRIAREINQSEEYVTFLEANQTVEVINNLPPAKRKFTWSKTSCVEKIPKTKILITGANKNVNKLGDLLSELKLYPEIIDRLIAIDNTKEFKNATESLTSQDGGGYESIKQLLYEDLKEKHDSIKDLINSSEKVVKRLENQNFALQETYKNFQGTIKQYSSDIELDQVDKDDFENIRNVLKLNSQYQDNLIEFHRRIEEKQKVTQTNIELFSKLQNEIPNKKQKYQTIEKFFDTLQLKKLGKVVQYFDQNKALIDSLYSELNQIHRDIKDNPFYDNIAQINLDFTFLFKSEINKLLGQNTLDQVPDEDEISKIQSVVFTIVKHFNEALTLYKRNNELINKNRVSPSQIKDKISEYERQLDKIKNPISFEPTDRIFTLSGRVEDEGNKKILKLYMPIKNLQGYISEKNPISFSHSIFPLLSEKNDKVPTALIEELSRDIKLTIKELKELDELQGELDRVSEVIKNDLNKFAQVNKVLKKITDIIKSWNEYITSQKSVVIEFIVKNVEMSKKDIKGFEQIEEKLKEIKLTSQEQLQSEFVSFGINYDEKKSLTENLGVLSTKVREFLGYSSSLLKIVSKISKFASENQEKYKKNCKDIELNKNLKDYILPTIQVIFQTIQKNIHLDKMEDNLMNQIIKHAQHFYYRITGEDFLKFKKVNENNNIYLRPYIRKKDGTEFPILDSGPSGSEQASVALGIMTALAQQFHSFIIIDETTNSFDFNTQLGFLKAIKEVSEDIFWIIVILVRTDKQNVQNEYDKLKESFPFSDIFQPIRDRKQLTSTFNRIRSFTDFQLSEEIYD